MANSLKDILYFDLGKAASLWSQIDDGLEQSATVAKGTSDSTQLGGKIGFSGLGLGGDHLTSKQTEVIATRQMHHSLLSKLEAGLSNHGLILYGSPGSPPSFDELCNYKYIAFTGAFTFDNYKKLNHISNNFKELVNFIAIAPDLENLDAIHPNSVSTLNRLARDLHYTSDDKERQKILKKLADTCDILITKLGSELNNTPEWSLLNIANWINVFASNWHTLRVSIPGSPTEAVANLRETDFIDGDSESTLFAYGRKPSVELTLLGAITDIPAKASSIGIDEEDMDDININKAFENMFDQLDGLEQHMRPIYYPRFGVQPIAIYRDAGLSS